MAIIGTIAIMPHHYDIIFEDIQPQFQTKILSNIKETISS